MPSFGNGDLIAAWKLSGTFGGQNQGRLRALCLTDRPVGLLPTASDPVSAEVNAASIARNDFYRDDFRNTGDFQDRASGTGV